MQSKRTLLDWSLLGALVVLFGSSFLLTKIVTASIPPFTAVMIRIWIAALVIAPIAFVLGHRPPALRQENGSIAKVWIYFFWLAVLGNAAPFAAIFWGMQSIDSSLGGILMSINPIATMILAHFTLHDERMTPRTVSGLGFGFVGMIILFGPQALAAASDGTTQLAAQLAVFSGALFYAANNVIARKVPSMSPTLVAACVLPIAAIVMTPIALIVDGSPLNLSPQPQAIAALLTLALLTTALATVIFMKLVASAGPTFLSLTNYLVPLFAIVLGVIAVGERPQVTAFVALAFVFCGLFLSQYRPSKKSSDIQEAATGIDD